MMRGFLISIAAVFGLVALAPAPAYAQDIFDKGCEGNSDSALCKDVKNNEDPITGNQSTIQKIIDLLLIGIGVASVIMLIIGGIKYVVSSGDPNNVKSAQNTILYAIIGLVVALFARQIITFVLSRI